MTRKLKPIAIIIFCFVYSQFFAQNNAPVREFRGVWVATTKFIDYPPKPGLNAQQLKDEYIKMLEMHKRNGMNAIIFQVRPAADAFFLSNYEPWSEWLTGKQGRAPEPFFDPLKFMIEETHKRGMEFHAWFNPFRAVATIGFADITENHITNRKPEWFITYGKNKYFDPGIPEVRNYIIEIISDVVKRYDIDGVHFDDYFYPYPVRDESTGTILQFNDFNTYNKYGNSFSDIDSWRRNNLDLFIEGVNKAIKKEKNWIKFGIGPGGIWRNKGNDAEGSDSRGLETYDALHADTRKWIKNGWVDYISPQIYWAIGNKNADFAKVAEWWSKNSYNRHIYIGHGVYRMLEEKLAEGWENPSQIPNQIRLSRKLPNIHGNAFYSSRNFEKNPNGINDTLQRNFYNVASYLPTMPWLDNVPPQTPLPKKIKTGSTFLVYWNKEDAKGKKANDTAVFYVVYKFYGKNIGKTGTFENVYLRTTDTYFTFEREKRIQLFGKKVTFVVTAFDKFHNESPTSKPITIKIKKYE